MAGRLASVIETIADMTAFVAMAIENPATEKYKDKIHVVKTPKKGGIGLKIL